MLPFPLFPPQASTLAPRTDHLLYYLLAVSAFFTVLIAGLIVVFSVRYRRRPGNERATQVMGSHRLELAWTVAPLTLLLVMYAWGASVYFYAFTPPPDALEVQGVGKQWMWKFQHLSGQREINELHVPVGRAVQVLLTSQDVIHSFFVPAFRVKQDAIPGRYTLAWFEATVPGRYHLFCAEYCGTLHSGMIGSVVAMEPAAFQQWLQGGATESPAQRGAKLFQDLGCDTCHRGDSLARGPDLTGLLGRPVRLRSGQVVVADAAYVRESILDPAAKVVDGYEPIMPTFKGLVTEEQILDLVSWLQAGP
ncbi:MAG TPA: cytochrome c oxidase subunit II [Candidatus Binatia bacterium]|nr:cytochrome c oxidase subunit II [Candidatus Binatia bacterium]